MKKGKFAASPKSKKPLYKKWWFWVAIVVVLAALFGNSEASDSGTATPSTVAQSTTESSAADALDLDVVFSNTFRNDVTGNWRKALVSTSSHVEDYALAYYREYFADDAEVHVIYNFGLNTVNCLTVTGNVLCVNITEYVDGEEHDAKKACGGLYYGTFQIDTNTGEILYSSFDK